jgi:ComF family protein
MALNLNLSTTLRLEARVVKRRLIHKIGAGIADLIWPPRSLLSDAKMDKPGTMEPELWQSLDFLFDTGCHCCGIPLPEAPTPESLCPVCIAAPPSFNAMRAPLAYDDVSKSLVLNMKHGARKDGVKVFANWMLEAAPYACQADLIMPVPLHWTRLWARGYNQAAWLAQALARRAGRDYAPLTLLRRRRTPSQNGLSASGRARNVEGAFAVVGDVRGKSILLVDDVFTTGATINACAKALLRAGAACVDGVALARVVRPTSIDIPEDDSGKGPSLLAGDHDG